MSHINSKKLKTFKSMLQGLTCEKHKIGHLTQQARADLNYQATLAEVDVNAIISYVVGRNADDRLAGIYLIDSICQNVGGKFVPLFEEHIFQLIETTYRYGSAQTRKSLCKILNIWKSRRIFPIDILRNIYKAMSSQPNPPPKSQPSSKRYPGAAPYGAPSQPNYHNALPPSFGAQQPPYFNGGGYPPPHTQPPPYYGEQFGAPPPLYPPPDHNNHHQPLPPYHHTGPYPQGPPMGPPPYGPPAPHGPEMDGWRGMCHKYGIPPHEYQRNINEIIADLNAFIESPYSYKDGIFVQTPQLQHANFQCKPQLVEEFRKCIDEFSHNHSDITRKLYFITTELKHDGVNTSQWQDKLNRIAPFLLSASSNPYGNSGAKNANVFGEICEFYNSIDGCRSGAKCKYLHVTDKEAELRRNLYKRVEGRYEYKDIKYKDDCAELKITTFYTYFGNVQDLKRKHARSISLLYSKKLKICPNCSLRITADAFAKHMKWHFHRRQAILAKKRSTQIKSQQYGKYRNWYCDEETWLNSNDTNKASKDAQKLDPFAAIKNSNTNSAMHDGANAANAAFMGIGNKEKEQDLYSSSQVLLGNVMQSVICQICQEEFTKKDKQYNAHRDDWILINACYVDGTTTKSYVSGKPTTNKPIVHRKCYELKKKQSNINGNGNNGSSLIHGNDDDEDDPLKPKLLNPDNIISKIEDQLNDKRVKSKLFAVHTQRKSALSRKRKNDEMLWASDDDLDDLDDEEEEDEDNDLETTNNAQNGKHDTNGGEVESNADLNHDEKHNGNVRKRRKLNNHHDENLVEEEDFYDDEDDLEDDDDDMKAANLDEDEFEGAKPIDLYANKANANANANTNDNEKASVKAEDNGTSENEEENQEEPTENEAEIKTKVEEGVDDEFADITLDEEEEQELDDLDIDDEDQEETGIVLFDPEQRPSYGFYNNRFG
eukprot:CAMPEP_0197029158 /NCGR_PEP_ID=MMETSP1384-20130603/8658_1 /TAXON_ID=29189 /ORGANISM="Ammonia sp." /LENGTH=939 /DNA_ID=CAMNT_0042458267 /DNA_START=43 /DNA_END=2862 /DNA_ORIENTATION=-